MKKYIIGAAVILLGSVKVSAQVKNYSYYKTIHIGDDLGWDYIATDETSRNLYFSHAAKTLVVSMDNDSIIAEIPKTFGVHGIAIDNELNRGFISNGKANSVTVFNLKNFTVIDTIAVTGVNPDAILYDGYSKKVFAFNGKTNNATVIDASTLKVIGTIALPGKPEFAVTDLKGKVYVNIEDKSELVQIDANIGALDNLSGDNTWSGTVTLMGAGSNGTDPLENQIGAQGGVLRVTGVIQHAPTFSATWVKTGDGDVVLGGTSANAYSGLTRVFGGRLILEKDGALGTAGSVSGASANTFQNIGSASTIAFRAPTGSGGLNYNTFETINTHGTGAPGFGQVDNLGGDNLFAGNIAFDGPTVSGSRQVSIGVTSGSLNVAGGLYARGNDGTPRYITKLGAGTLIVSGDGGAATGNALVVPFVNSTFQVNAGTVEMRGPSLATANLPGVTTWNVSNGGTLVASSGRFTTGTVNVAAAGQFNLTGGSTDVTTIDLTVGGSFGFTGGTLHAQTIQGNVNNQGGTLSPGNSPGSTAIVGNYTQQSGGTLAIEIGGTVAATGFDAVSVSGSALVGGLLDVSLINGFTPTPGQSFTVMTAGSVAYNGLALGGSAANLFYLLVGPSSITLQAAGLPGDFNFDGTVDAADYVLLRKGPGYLPTHYDLWRSHFGDPAGSGSGAAVNSFVPEPATSLLLICGLLPLWCRRRGRRT